MNLAFSFPARRLVIAAGLGLTMLIASDAQAQIDRVYPHTGNPIAGRLTEVRRDGVVVESSSGKQTVGVERIRRILFDGDPAGLVRGREAALDGQYEQALEELGRLDINAIRRDEVKADAMFYLALSESQLALAGRGNAAEAKRKMLAFVSAHPQNIHFYRAARALGDLAVFTGEFDQAVRYYGGLNNAPAAELKLEAEYLIGIAKLRQGKPDEAETNFGKVAGANVESPTGARLQTLAKAGRAMSLAKQKKGDEAVALSNTLVEQLDTSDAEMAARVYNARGAGYEAKGDHQGALLAYLHTHLMFSGQADAHAEALSRLVELWPKVGNPERANTARQELQQRYPGWSR